MLNTDFLDPTYVLDLNTCLLSLKEYAAKVDLVESAFASMDYYKTDLEKLCSVYRSLIKNHAFFDANKRTASLYLKSGLESLGYDVDQIN